MMAQAPQKVLITGGLGYVGGRIATHLRDVDLKISIRLMTHRAIRQAPPWARSLDVVRANVLDQKSLETALDGIDTVIHLAAVNENESSKDLDLALDVNGRATYRLLQACHAREVSRFIYFSTFHVYGPGARQPITEETPTRPVHPYAITHRLAEDFVNWHRHTHGMKTLVLRLSNGYGYPADTLVERWTLVFNDLCMQAIRDSEIRLRSSGTQERDFMSLGDVAKAVHHFLQLSPEEWEDGLFNLGGDCSMSILQVAQRVAAEYSNYCGKQLAIVIGEPGDSQKSDPVVYNIDKLKKTGFSPTDQMSEEILGTFRVCEQLSLPNPE